MAQKTNHGYEDSWRGCYLDVRGNMQLKNNKKLEVLRGQMDPSGPLTYPITPQSP